MARDLGEWDPRYEDYVGWGGAGQGHLLPPQPPTRSAGHSWAAGRRTRGLYVKNVPGTMNAESLRRLFSEYGRVESVVMGRAGPDSSRPRWAIVNPHSTRDAVGMVSALHGRPPLCLSVTLAISPEEKRRQKREKEEQQRFLEEVRREVLAARSKETTPAVKTDSGDVMNTIVTTSATDTTTTTTTSSSPVSSSSTTTTTTSSPSVNSNTPTTLATTTATTTTTLPGSTTSHNKTTQAPFEVSCGMVVVAYCPAEPCVWCGAAGQLVCSVCGVWYCKKVCQEAHWQLHQDFCTPASASPLTTEQEGPSSVSSKVPECYTMD